MLRKGAIPTRFIMAMILGLLVTALIAGILMDSPLRDVIDQGNQQVKEVSGGPVVLDDSGESSPKQKLGALMRFTYHKAKNFGCMSESDSAWSQDKAPTVPWENNNQEGYEALGDTWIGRYPECFGASSTAVSQLQTGSTAQSGMDQEGMFSRQRFRIPENAESAIILKSEYPDNAGSDGLKHWKDDSSTVDEHFLLASKEPYEQVIRDRQECDNAQGLLENIVDVGIIDLQLFEGEGAFVTKARGTGSYYTLFFENNPDRNRPIQASVQEWRTNPIIYCGGYDSTASGNNPPVVQLVNSAVNENYEFNTPYVYLCPGDEGYVQVNQDRPLNEGEGGAGGISTFNTYPRIVITNNGDCGKVLSGPALRFASGEEGRGVTSTITTDSNDVPNSINFETEITNKAPTDSNVEIQVKSSGTVVKSVSRNVGASSTKTYGFSKSITASNPVEFVNNNCEFNLVLLRNGNTMDTARNNRPDNYLEHCEDNGNAHATIKTTHQAYGAERTGMNNLIGPAEVEFSIPIKNNGYISQKYKVEIDANSNDDSELIPSDSLGIELNPGEPAVTFTTTMPVDSIEQCDVELRLRNIDTGETVETVEANLYTDFGINTAGGNICGNVQDPVLKSVTVDPPTGRDQTYDVQVTVENPENGYQNPTITSTVNYPEKNAGSGTESSSTRIARNNQETITTSIRQSQLDCVDVNKVDNERVDLRITRDGNDFISREITPQFCN